jgi:formylglycine-generating enzyme required for sulfatase activity
MVSSEDLPTPPVGHPSEEGILLTCGWGMGILIVSMNILTSAAPVMSYCISPACLAPDKNSPTTNFCMSCGAKILLKDHYRALKLLGQGGFGKTFKAVDEDQPRKPLCVIKQFAFSNNHPETRQIALKLFYEEAQHLETLGKHDQIPELLAYFDVEGQPYLVQQFIDGQDLEQELATAGTFNQAKIRELLESLLPVLDFLHHQSPPVIHRDIKPANIIRRRSDGGLVLVDFGAAKQATQSILAKTGTAIGSAEFAAPEQARRKPVFASDIYSLGVTCIYLLTQVSPFDLFDMNQDAWVWRDYLVDNPVDEKLGKVLDKMIANSLAQRYQSAADVLALLGQDSARLNAPFSIKSFPIPSAIKPRSQAIPIQQSRHIFDFETAKLEVILKTEFFIEKEIITKTGFFGGKKQIEVEKQIAVEKPPQIKITKISSTAEYIIENLGKEVDLEMVYVPAGSFMMGSNDNDEGKPIHQVTIAPFFMGRYSITQQQYHAIVGENPSEFKGDNRPVEKVSWDDGMEFCQKLSQHTGKQYTLPTESQWEYACKAGTTTPFYFGETITPDLVNYEGKAPSYLVATGKFCQQTTDVGFFPANAFGLCDLHGNVWEWCLDTWHENYIGAPKDGSAWIEDSRFYNSRFHSVRGGAYHNPPAHCGSASRTRHMHDFRMSSIGFRVVCAL